MLRRVVLFLPFVLLAGCSINSNDPKKEGSDEIRLSLPTEPPTLDWNLATDNVSYQILNQLMEGLTQFDDEMRVIPAAAESWEVKDGGQNYIFHLNKNYRWSDGKPVTANDFRDSWLRLLDPVTAAEYAYFLFDIIGAKEFNSGQLKDPGGVGIRVVDDLTLEVYLKNPVVFFPSITTFMVTFPIRFDLIERYDDKWTDPENLITCGPYTLKEWWHEYRLTLAKNPQYGGSPVPQIEQIRIFLVSDPSTVLSLYETGKLDLAAPPPIALPKYKNHPDLVSAPKLRGYYYGFNIEKEPFDDPLLRKAFAMALDKKEIPQILKGGELAVDSWIPQGMFGFNENIGIRFDPEKAKRLLAHAGYVSQKNFPVVALMFNTDPVNKKLAEWAQSQWKKHLSIEVKLENQEWKSYLSLLRNDPPPLFRLGWGADYPDPDNFMNLFTSYSGNNHTGWENKAFDNLIASGAREENPAKRKEIYDKAQELLLEEETVIIPLFVARQNVLIRGKLKPFPLIPMDFVYYKRVQNR